MTDVTLFKVITAVETALKNGLGDLVFTENMELTDLSKDHQKLIRMNWQDDDKLFINVDLGMDKVEKGLNQLFVPSFRKELINHKSCYTKPTSKEEYINEYYSTFEEIKLDGGLICLYKVSPIEAVKFEYEISNDVTDRYKRDQGMRGKKYADKRLKKNMEKKLFKDIKDDVLATELESLIIQIAFIVEA